MRQYLKEHLIPYIQQHNKKNFTFRIHDLRASYGMNQTDIQLALVENGDITLHKARITVMALMGHESSATLNINGNAGSGVAENIMSGRVHIKGSASQYAASSGHGGLVVIEGDASSRCGISMKGVNIVVGGSVGHMSAFLAQKGCAVS